MKNKNSLASDTFSTDIHISLTYTGDILHTTMDNIFSNVWNFVGFSLLDLHENIEIFVLVSNLFELMIDVVGCLEAVTDLFLLRIYTIKSCQILDVFRTDKQN